MGAEDEELDPPDEERAAGREVSGCDKPPAEGLRSGSPSRMLLVDDLFLSAAAAVISTGGWSGFRIFVLSFGSA